jgi:hypothetical protein
MKSPKTGEEECRHLFRMRMQRDGREKELDELIAKHKEQGKSRRQSICAAMREMGYPGPEKERRLWEAAKGKAMMNRRRQNNRDFKKKYYERRRMDDIEKAILSLPQRAPVETEWNWVRNHVAMTRKKRQADREKLVEVSVVDVLEAGHGKAPSQFAAQMLINYVDSPDEFFKLVMGEDKKSVNTSGPGTSENKEQVTDDLSHLKRVHAQFVAAKQAK